MSRTAWVIPVALLSVSAVSLDLGSWVEASSPQPPLVITANPTPASQLVPEGGFEPPTFALTAPQVYYSGQQVGGWDFGPGSGVADASTSGFFDTPLNVSSVVGAQAAFLQNYQGSVSRAFNPPGRGAFRVSVRLGKRQSGDETTVEILLDTDPATPGVGESRIALETIEHDGLERYVSVPFTALSSTQTFELTIRRDPTTGAQSHLTAALIDDVRIEEVLPWSAATSWSLGVPGPNDSVVIGAGSAILMDGACVAKTIACAGDLVAMPNGPFPTVSLEAESILVYKGQVVGDAVASRLEVGREGIPYDGDFTIVLVGTDTTPDMSNGDRKALRAMESGLIDLHGTPITPWTRLQQTVVPTNLNGYAGTPVTNVMVENAEGWGTDDTIAITASVYDRNRWLTGVVDPAYVDYSDTAVVSSASMILPNLWSLPLDPNGPSVDNPHLGRTASSGLPTGATDYTTGANYPTGAGLPTDIDQSSYVANLTRNIRITSSPSAKASGGGNWRFGGHVMVMKNGDAVGGFGRFSYVEFDDLGRDTPNGLGRYPVHFHMLKTEGHGQYVRGCSIHDTSNRAIVVHGTDGVDVSDNVVYRARGHAIFLEDGSEMFNVLDGNLVAETIRPEQGREVIPSDNSLDLADFQARSPSAYWITNPYNQVTNNVAAGTIGTGFWFVFPRRVLGLSADDDDLNFMSRVSPLRLPMWVDEQGTLLRDNTAAVCRIGLHFGNTITDPDDEYSDDSGSENQGILKGTWWVPSVSSTGSVAEPDLNQRSEILGEMTGFTTYGCYSGFYGSTGGDRLRLSGYNSMDCDRHLDLASYTLIEKAVLSEEGNLFRVNTPAFNNFTKGVVIYDGAGRYDEIHFRGFTGFMTAAGGTTISHASGVGSRGAATLHANQLFGAITHDPVGAPNTGPGDMKLHAAVFRGNEPGSLANGVLPGVTTVGGIDQIDDPVDGAGMTIDPTGVNWNAITFTSAQSSYAPSKWGVVLRDDSGSLSGTPSAGGTLITAHPWARTGDPTEVDYVFDAAAPPLNNGNSWNSRQSGYIWSPNRFGHLRLFYRNQSDEKQTVKGDRNADFDITRVDQGAANPLRFRHAYRPREMRQLPVIVETGNVHRFEHKIAHFNSVSPTPGLIHDFGGLDISLDDCNDGDWFVIELDDLAGQTASTVSAHRARTTQTGVLWDEPAAAEVQLTPYTTLAAAIASGDTALSIEPLGATTKVHLVIRIKGPGSADASLPAGLSNKFRVEAFPGAPVYSGSNNRKASEWRRERVRLDW